ncbi:uncharacterized protein LOC110017862 isoform X2 [Phalaenopsis equestris]|uniref:uncharacterized protein LOC110017862 isoform X2 n=1 Tax=Phalaenopsis equestris TaxID=78828 RepID=UPI0009E38F73|nr:uncharacterized protein LOC110017862 isoform X2 [Phalaenopsis equestris]
MSATKPLVKPFLFILPLSLLLLLLPLLSRPTLHPTLTRQLSPSSILQIRPGFRSYDDYLNLQLNKTLNPRLRHLWATRDWNRKIAVFSRFFVKLQERAFLSNTSRALCIGARIGQEVAALRTIGVADSIGMDLVASPPLVVQGDFHSQPFEDHSFDFEFSNVFDHALYPDRFVGEIERTLRPGGVCVLHVALTRRADRYSANDLYAIEGVTVLFVESDLVRVRKIDGFGLDTELVLRKKRRLSFSPLQK